MGEGKPLPHRSAPYYFGSNWLLWRPREAPQCGGENHLPIGEETDAEAKERNRREKHVFFVKKTFKSILSLVVVLPHVVQKN